MKANPKLDWETPIKEVCRALGLQPGAKFTGKGEVRAVFGTPARLGDASVVMLSRRDYDALVKRLEDSADLAAVRADKKNAGDYLPADQVDRLLAGETALRVWREYRGLTLDGLAAKAAEYGAEVGKSHLSHIETGRARASLDLMAALAKALGVPLDALTG
jgi:mRNA interferase RelE/StbE